ncbi:hypothetical protein BT69DRAFT_570307 [Atractiella rhizophila]|nr:hypothetical protein BT69DRAFT_570307 [Atractiella rhizophila]
MHVELKVLLSSSLKHITPFIDTEWQLVNTSGKIDSDFVEVFGVNGAKPDIFTKENTVMKKTESFGEFKKLCQSSTFRCLGQTKNVA